MTSAVVAVAPLLVNVMLSMPLLLVNVAKVKPPDCRLLPDTVNRAPEVLKPKVSDETAEPERCTVRLPPDQLPLPPLSAPKSASASAALALASRATVLPMPAQETESLLRLLIVGAELGL